MLYVDSPLTRTALGLKELFPVVGVQTELQLLKDDGGGHCFKSATATVDAN